MGSRAIKLSPNYDTLKWSLDLSFCGAHSMTSLESITKPFIVLGVQGPTHPGQVYIYSVPAKKGNKVIIPISDKFFTKESMAEVSFKGLSHFEKDWSFVLKDTQTNKKKQITCQDSFLVRPRFFNSIRSLDVLKENMRKSPSRLELHITLGSVIKNRN